MNLRDQLKKAKLLDEKRSRQLAHEERVHRKKVGRDGVEAESKQRGEELTKLQAQEREQIKQAQAELDAQRKLKLQAAKAEAQGDMVMWIASDVLLGYIVVGDRVRSGAAQAVSRLKRDDIVTVLLTGDTKATAQAVGGPLGVDSVLAGVLPAGKAESIQRLQTDGVVVAMVGDGVNDAPALAQADVGIAMGTGTDAAMESAGVTLVKGDLRGIVRAVALSHRTMRNIRQNLFFAFIYNALGVPVAAGVLYPIFGLLLNPMIAAAAMSFSSVSVIANALRLGTIRLSSK